MIYQIMRVKYGSGVAASLSGLIVLFAPTVVLNAAAWGQIDSIYTAGLLACVNYLLRKKNWLASHLDWRFPLNCSQFISYRSSWLCP